MTENEFILADRIAKIKATVEKNGEENFSISYSGGKDSCVLSTLTDMALPGNQIPRVYADTGIELNAVRNFVIRERERDGRIHLIKPETPVTKMLAKEGYPFKSKEHSQHWREYAMGGANLKHIQRYLGQYKRKNDSEYTFKRYMCPKVLRFQFTPEYLENGLKLSEMCCARMKEEPFQKWQIENNRRFAMVGLMHDEGGRRNRAKCLAFKKNNITNFQPLVVVTKEWEEWFVKEANIKIPMLYYPPYNFDRTGCKGCPFNPHLQRELDTLEKFFPGERKQCELIWGPVYAEYRRLGYRLKPLQENRQITIDEWYRTLE